MELGRLLRVDHGDARQRLLVAEVALITVEPAIEVFDHGKPAAVVQCGGEFGEPGPKTVRNSVEGPEAYLGAALHGVFPTIRLFEPDAEDAADRFAAHGGAELLAALAAGPRRGDAAAPLAIREQDRRALARGLHVEIGQRAAAGVGNVTCGDRKSVV